MTIELYHGIDAPLKFDQTQTKHNTGKSKPNLESGSIVRVIHQSITKCHQFENFNFYKVVQASLARSVHLPYRTL